MEAGTREFGMCTNSNSPDKAFSDYGTMLESLVPWTTTTLFMVATLGVAWEDYVRWQILSLANLAVAPLLLALGVGMFKSAKRVDHSA